MIPGLPHSLEVLRGREFRLLFAAQAVSGLGNQMPDVWRLTAAPTAPR